MKVPFWNASKQYLQHKDEILSAIDRVLSKGELTLGDYGKDITEFEEWFAEYIGVKHAIMTGSGTQSLYLAYKALGIGPGDEVITVGHTFSATFDQIVALGATPILVDIGEDGLIDPEEVEKAITSKTKAIVPVHLEGKVCQILNLVSLGLEHNIKIVEDAAQALGAGVEVMDGTGFVAGSLGEIGCFSLFPAKILGSVGNAGMLTTNDDELAYKLRMLRCNYRFEKDLDKVDYGMNFEPDNVQAAVLNVRKIYLEGWLARRKEIAEKYLEAFKDLPIKLSLNQSGRVWQDFVIRVDTETKPKLLKYLDEHEVGYLGHDIVPYSKYPKLKLPELPKTNQYLAEQIRLPCRPEHTDEEIDYVIKTIKDFYGQ